MVVTAVSMAVGAAAVGGLYALDRVANEVVHPKPRMPEVTPTDLGLHCEDVEIPSHGHILTGSLLTPDGPARGPLLLLAHGWGASEANLLQLAEPLVQGGRSVLLFNVRGHGRNEPVAWATVRDFRDDVLAVIRWAAQRFPDRPRVLIGHSLGGSAGVLAVDAGAPVAGLVTIASPANVLEVTADYLTDKGFPGSFMVVALRPFWWWRLRGTFRNLVPERKIGRLRTPLLILQPENDRRVSRDHADRLARSAGLPVHVVEGVGHNEILAAPETLARIEEFLDGLD